MTNILEDFPFPWHDRLARELHAALADINPTAKGALWAAERGGLSHARLNTDQAAFDLWRDILNQGASGRCNPQLIRLVLEANPRHPRAPLLAAILQHRPVELERPPRDADGAPTFLAASDDITEAEALLFHDDLTIEVGRLPWLIAVLQRLHAVSRGICKMKTGVAGSSQSGSGFRVGPDLLMTNWHVVTFDGVAATRIEAEFGFDDDGQGGGLPSTNIICEPARTVASREDDWAVVRTATPLSDAIPIIRLSDPGTLTIGAPGFVIQHPGGLRKRIAFVRNQITDFDDRVAHYLSDTQQGSSGAPVLDEHCRILALHRAGGRPQEVAGRPPLRKNEGVRIARIVAATQAQGLALA